jgi:hypothetical protein
MSIDYYILYCITMNTLDYIFRKHASFFVADKYKINSALNKEFFSTDNGSLESVLVSWDLSVYKDNNVLDRNVCGKSGKKFNPEDYWHCELCCIENNCQIKHNKSKCTKHFSSCYTNFKTDTSLMNNNTYIFTYIFGTKEGRVAGVDDVYFEEEIKEEIK